MTWFGSLDLAYKYTIVFASLLLLTIVGGFCKVLYNRRRLKKHVKQAAVDAEAGPKEDQVELNQREKDEGDLFGIRAIEAGYFAGIAQSRPTSRAGSYVETTSLSTNTLVDKLNIVKDQNHSMSNSVISLPLAHVNGTRDSGASSNSPPRRKTPPTIRLAPSEAELNGRINHNGAVNMSLNVPPSPVLAQPRSPTFGGSDSDSDGRASPRSLSPRDATFRPDHYAPRPPQIPMPQGLRPSIHHAEETANSLSASFNEPSPGSSPGHSAPPSPGHPPTAKLPLIPTRAARDGQSNTQPDRPNSPVRLLPQTYQPTHQRDISNSSSVYDNYNRTSTHHHSVSADSNYNFSFPVTSDRNSANLSTMPDHGREPSTSSSLLAPNSVTSNQTNDPRFSEFYDAYYRHSQLGVASTTEVPKRPNMLNFAQPTIVEVDSPLPSPNPQTTVHQQPGVAW